MPGSSGCGRTTRNGIPAGALDVDLELLPQVLGHHVAVERMGDEIIDRDHMCTEGFLGEGAGHERSFPAGVRAPKMRRFKSQSGQSVVSHRLASVYSHPMQSRHLSFTAAGMRSRSPPAPRSAGSGQPTWLGSRPAA